MNPKLRSLLLSLGINPDQGHNNIRFQLNQATAAPLPKLADAELAQLREFVGETRYRATAQQRFLPASLNKETRTITGVVATENPVPMVDWELWEIVDEILLSDALALDEARGAQVPFQNAHDLSDCHKTIGSTVNLRVENKQILGDNVFSSVEEDLFIKAQEGHLRDTSVGYQVKAAQYIKPGETVTVNGRSFTAGARTLKVVTKWTIHENSLCPVGADNRSGLRQINSNLPPQQPNPKEGKPKMNPQLRTLLVTLLSMPELFSDEQARAFAVENKLPSDDNLAIAEMKKRFTAQPQQVAPPVVPPTAPDSELIEAGKRALIVQEADQIFAFCPDLKHLQEECRTAILAGTMDMKAVRAKILAERAKVPTPGINIQVTHGGEEQFRSRMANAILTKFDKTSRSLSKEQLQGANEFRNLTLLDMARTALSARGVNTYNLPPSETFRMSMRHSTSDFPNIIATVLRSSIKMGYESVISNWRSYCGIESLPDFESHRIVQLGGSGKLNRVKEKEEYKKGKLKDKAETIRLAKFGEECEISWETMLAGKLDAILSVPFNYAQRWAYTLNSLPVELLLANAALADSKALFHADHHNLIHGTAYAPTDKDKASAAIKKHRTTLLNQKPIDTATNANASLAIGIPLTHIICGSTNEEFVYAALFEGGRGESNAEAFLRNQNIKLVSDPLVGLGSGGSENFLFGIGAGNTNPAIIMGLLEGNENLMISEEQRANDTLVYHITGAAEAGIADHRGVTKSTGIVAP